MSAIRIHIVYNTYITILIRTRVYSAQHKFHVTEALGHEAASEGRGDNQSRQARVPEIHSNLAVAPLQEKSGLFSRQG